MNLVCVEGVGGQLLHVMGQRYACAREVLATCGVAGSTRAPSLPEHGPISCAAQHVQSCPTSQWTPDAGLQCSMPGQEIPCVFLAVVGTYILSIRS